MPFEAHHTLCVSCKAFISINPNHCPSIRIDGEKQPLCRDCFDRWNEIHRTSKGLEPVPLHPEAYNPVEI